MATTLFPTSAASTAALPAGFTGTKKVLAFARGSGVTTQTDNTIASLGTSMGASQAKQWWAAAASNATSTSTGLVWVTEPLNAFTISGTTDSKTINIRA